MSMDPVMKLVKHHIYPTYQLHAVMANKKTAPRDGLRLAALITLEWLRERLGEDTPELLRSFPEPSAYQTISEECLGSIHIHTGFDIDIVSLPQDGIWSLQLTEPDLGSEPGDLEQRRAGAPGRMVETNIAYKIIGDRLECGVQMMISDPEGTPQKAGVRRPAVIGRLMEHPAFGLHHISRLTRSVQQITTVDQLKTLQALLRDNENQLPCVIFTQLRNTREVPSLPGLQPGTELPFKYLSPGTMGQMGNMGQMGPLGKIPLRSEAEEPPYDMEQFAAHGVTYCRTCLLDDSLLDRFRSTVKKEVQPGDIVVLEPIKFGGAVWTLSYKPSKLRQEEAMQQLRDKLYGYCREKAFSFGGISFLSAVREKQLQQLEENRRQTEQLEIQWQRKLDRLNEEWRARSGAWEHEKIQLSEQLERQWQYQERLEKEKEELRTEVQAEVARARASVSARDEEINYLRRKLKQPEEHDRIAAWAADHFEGRLYLHPRAIDLLKERSAKEINIDLICDALDFLATDYWARRYQQLSTEEMNHRCSQKYGRPFDVRPTGTTTVEFTPTQYKIKYFPDLRGKPKESPLDYHLCVGNDPGNLLRIYFLHDDENQLIVVGSLPHHLKAVTVR